MGKWMTEEEVCSMEDAVMTLLEHFVEPFLTRYRTRQVPLPSQHQTMTKQAETSESVLMSCNARCYNDMIGTTRYCSNPSLVQSSMQGGSFSLADLHHKLNIVSEGVLLINEIFVETSINKSDLVALDSHIIFSVSKPKAVVRVYVMQCTDLSMMTFGFLLKISLKGPIVKRSSYGWMVTPLGMYFHMLPYMEALLHWISRTHVRTQRPICTPFQAKGQHINTVFRH